jgi:pimeloyl-ACP methyl ester carboxylesterase
MMRCRKTSQKSQSIAWIDAQNLSFLRSVRRGIDSSTDWQYAQCYGFDLRLFRPFRADLSIRKSSSFFPSLIAATSQRGRAATRPGFAVTTTIFRGNNLLPPSQCASPGARWPLEEINVPTLVISAPDDLFNTLPAAEFAANSIPNAKLVVYDGSPAGWASAVGDFIAQQAHSSRQQRTD